jgi:tetratricopeptide (TPR) repeat protein
LGNICGKSTKCRDAGHGANVYRARGLTEVKLGHHAEAIADFTVGLSLKKNSVSHAYRGWAYLVTKSPRLALADFDAAIQLDEHNGDAYSGRGFARLALGGKFSDYQKAVADADKALGHGSSKDPRRLWNAARIYAQAAAKLEAKRRPRRHWFREH